MYKYLIKLIPAVFLTATAWGGMSCYDYPMENFNIVHEYTTAEGSFKSEKVDSGQVRLVLAVPDRLNKLMQHTFFLYRNGKLMGYNPMECYEFRGTTGGYECQGECDSGHVIVGSHHELRAKNGILFGETIDSPQGDWDLNWRKSGSLIYPHKIACPAEALKKIPTDEYVDKKYIKKHASISKTPYRNVCYGKKELRLVDGKWQPLYSDCEIGKNTCEEMGMERFGHYSTEKSARSALIRCQHSMPKTARE